MLLFALIRSHFLIFFFFFCYLLWVALISSHFLVFIYGINWFSLDFPLDCDYLSPFMLFCLWNGSLCSALTLIWSLGSDLMPCLSVAHFALLMKWIILLCIDYDLIIMLWFDYLLIRCSCWFAYEMDHYASVLGSLSSNFKWFDPITEFLFFIFFYLAGWKSHLQNLISVHDMFFEFCIWIIYLTKLC